VRPGVERPRVSGVVRDRDVGPVARCDGYGHGRASRERAVGIGRKRVQVVIARLEHQLETSINATGYRGYLPRAVRCININRRLERLVRARAVLLHDGASGAEEHDAPDAGIGRRLRPGLLD